MTQNISLVLALMAGCLGQLTLLAQTGPLYLALKGASVSISGATGGSGYDVQVVGNYAYVAWLRDTDTNHPGGLEIFDVTDPSNPVRVGAYDSQAQVNAVRVVGHYAYLAEGTSRFLTNDSGAFELIDVGDPTAPVRTGGTALRGHANSMHIDGKYAYVPESTRWTGSNFLGALEIFDVSTPTNPIRLATYDTGGSATSVAVSGGYAYLADGVTDLQVLDVSNPASPRRVGGYDTDEWRNFGGFEHGGAAIRMQVVGNLVYSTGEDGLHILDVSDPANPVRLGGFNSFPFWGSFCLAGHYAYATLYNSIRGLMSLYTFDVNDPTNPILVSRDPVLGNEFFQVVGRRVYFPAGYLLIYEFKERPVIKASRTGGTLFLSWGDTPGFILQHTASLADPDWSDVPGSEGQSGIELPVGNGREFFRLARP